MNRVKPPFTLGVEEEYLLVDKETQGAWRSIRPKTLAQ